MIGRQRKWFKLDDAIAELSVHKPVQCKYVTLLSKDTNQVSSENSTPSTLDTAQHLPKASVSSNSPEINTTPNTSADGKFDTR